MQGRTTGHHRDLSQCPAVGPERHERDGRDTPLGGVPMSHGGLVLCTLNYNYRRSSVL